MKQRVQKLMADAGIGSRRHNEDLIRAGRVKINDRQARLGDKADPISDVIEVDGQRLTYLPPVYVKVYKPKGVISSTEDELGRGRKTVRDLVPLPGHLFAIGRLDKQSEGLMLLTNDGNVAHRLTHPRYGHEKTYRVVLEGQISFKALDQWRSGVELDERTTAPVEIEVVNRQRDHTLLRITMREGRKRQIRRIAAGLGYPVTSLLRERIGPIELGNLQPGQWRRLTPAEEKELLRQAAGRRSAGKRQSGGAKSRDVKRRGRRRAGET